MCWVLHDFLDASLPSYWAIAGLALSVGACIIAASFRDARAFMHFATGISLLWLTTAFCVLFLPGLIGAIIGAAHSAWCSVRLKKEPKITKQLAIEAAFIGFLIGFGLSFLYLFFNQAALACNF